MFTVKLFKGHSIKLVCGEIVDIHPVGPAHPDDPEKKPSTSVLEIAVCQGSDNRSFYVADNSAPRPSNFGVTIDFYDMAYIENAGGATTQKVKPNFD